MGSTLERKSLFRQGSRAMVLGIVLRRGVLLMCIIVGHGPSVLAVGMGWVIRIFFSRQ